VRVFVTKRFARFARKERIGDATLCDAVSRAEQGLVDADLGGGLFKQRVARPGQGKSGGYRVILAFRAVERTVFMYGFAKNEVDNIDDDDLAKLKKAAGQALKWDDEKVATMLADGAWIEVHCDAEEV
jgi:hypothetical protein